MSIETGSATAPISASWRPLPPSVQLNAATGNFSGTAEPGTTVRLTGNEDQRMYTATVDANGGWTIALGKSPRLYTTFEVWVCNSGEGVSSERVNFTYGGSNPKLVDVYASETIAFGRCTSGIRVVVFGPEGQVLGRALALGEHGVWAVRFRNSVKAGDTVCVLAEAIGGNTSMPLFTKAETFSVNDHNVGHIAGAGAEPGDLIQLYDTAKGQVIASTVVSGDSAWEFSFCDPIEAGTRILVQRTHMDGTTSSGPVFTADYDGCQSPVITSYSSNVVGRANPGLEVTYTQLRDGESVHSDTVTTPANGLWSSATAADDVTLDLQPGDVLVASTESADGTRKSQLTSNVTVNGSRPGTPLIESIDSDGATGWAEPHKFIVASTVDEGVVAVAESGWLGYWTLSWKDYAGSLSSTTVVTFEACDSLVKSNTAPTSLVTARYADTLAAKPEAPVIIKYMATDIGGTEATPDTAVVVHNTSRNDEINPTGEDVIDGIWEIYPTGANVPMDGNEIRAVAWSLDTFGNMVVASDPSGPQRASTFFPPPPIVTVMYPHDIEGLEEILDAGNRSMTTIYIAPELDIARVPVGNSGHLTGRNWKIIPPPNRTPGEQMVAWALTDAGAKSTEFPFTIKAAEKPIPPSIGNWDTPTINGSGVNGTLVSLYVDENLYGSSVVVSRGWSVTIGTVAPADGTKLKAIAKDQSTGNESDPFYVVVGADRSTLQLDNSAITTSSAGGTVSLDNQLILGWRQSDGLQVISYSVAKAGPFTATYLADSNIKSGDYLMVSAQDATDPEGMMSSYDGKQVD